MNSLRIHLAAVSAVALTMQLSAPLSAGTPRLVEGRVKLQVLPSGALAVKSDCSVHLIEVADQSSERTYPCATWFQPPIGRYLFWLEQADEISHQSVLRYAGEAGSGLVMDKATMAAGLVQLDRHASIPADATFRVISLEQSGAERAFDRRIRASRATEPFRVPAGFVLSGIFDRNGDALALSRPRAVLDTGVTTLLPGRPRAAHATLVAVLRRGSVKGCQALLLSAQDATRLPDATASSGDRLVVAWYDLPAPAEATFEVKCPSATPFSREISLSPGRIETVRAVMP